MQPAVALPTEIRPPSEREFVLFQKLIHREAGICLTPAKKTLLVSRLRRRLCELGLPSFGAYYRHLTRDDPAEQVRMLDRICTNETRFFREAWQFDLLTRTVLPRVREQGRTGGRRRRLRVWSAGCSSGEEPYSLAMALLHHLPEAEGWSVDILATDLSTRVLDRAREAVYPIERAREIPADLLRLYTQRLAGPGGARMKVGPEARALVRFERLNLCGDPYPPGPPFDLVFCRNVLIYFDEATRASVVTRLLRRLDPRGLIFLGHAEALIGRGHDLCPVAPMTYARRSSGDTWQ